MRYVTIIMVFILLFTIGCSSISSSKNVKRKNNQIEISGYKNTTWGSSKEEVEETLGKRLIAQSSPGKIIFDDTEGNVVFERILYGYLQQNLDQIIFFDYSYFPKYFEVMKTPEGDECTFYKGSFFAYSFAVEKDNFDNYLSSMQEKYGSPDISVQGVPSISSLVSDVYLWPRGKTTLAAIKKILPDDPYAISAFNLSGQSRKSLNPLIIYCSSEILDEAKSYIGDKIGEEQKQKENELQKIKEKDLEKIF